MKFGDILRYPDSEGVGDEILFMFLAKVEHRGMEYIETIVLRTTADDDQWAPGQRVLAGCDELIPYIEPGTKVFVDGKELDVAGIDWAASETSAHAVLTIRDASGSISGSLTLSAETLLEALRV